MTFSFDYSSLYRYLEQTPLAESVPKLQALINERLQPQAHGDYSKWMQALQSLPDLPVGSIDLDVAKITAQCSQAMAANEQQHLTTQLQQFIPWRKGPYHLHGCDIDTEWRSDWKWDRLAANIENLEGRKVLDVGCGNGYHCWRMLGAGAELVVGLDPMLLFVMQFWAVTKLLGKDLPVYVLPIACEEFIAETHFFDTVFSMGVLYHRRSPIEHLYELKNALAPGGQLVLETLVVDGDERTLLIPNGRYAQMRNVWFLPSCENLVIWLKRCGFARVEIVDINQTTTQEQRATEWMPFNSLRDFLDPDNMNKTIEGYPAPKRAVLLAS